jgi:D-hexose-6-phosphate mutarotase
MGRTSSTDSNNERPTKNLQRQDGGIPICYPYLHGPRGSSYPAGREKDIACGWFRAP